MKRTKKEAYNTEGTRVTQLG